MLALIIVDVQNDFLPGGPLGVPQGTQVIATANAAIRSTREAGGLVVATQDLHPADHGSFASQHPQQSIGDVVDLDGLEQILWPDHCVESTTGAELASELDTAGIHRVFTKGGDRNVDSYSGFYDNGRRRSTGLAEYLKSEGVTHVHVLGLATDYCVKFTALDAAQEGFDVTLLLDGCRGVELHPGDIDAALAEMREAGVRVSSRTEISPC